MSSDDLIRSFISTLQPHYRRYFSIHMDLGGTRHTIHADKKTCLVNVRQSDGILNSSEVELLKEGIISKVLAFNVTLSGGSYNSCFLCLAITIVVLCIEQDKTRKQVLHICGRHHTYCFSKYPLQLVTPRER
jgi:hypothetical protein